MEFYVKVSKVTKTRKQPFGWIGIYPALDDDDETIFSVNLPHRSVADIPDGLISTLSKAGLTEWERRQSVKRRAANARKTYLEAHRARRLKFQAARENDGKKFQEALAEIKRLTLTYGEPAWKGVFSAEEAYAVDPLARNTASRHAEVCRLIGDALRSRLTHKRV